MRLNDHPHAILRRADWEYFEPDVVVPLWGSHLDDARRGGDIDLLVETRLMDAERIAKPWVRFMSAVNTEFGEQKTDLLINCLSN